MPIRHRKVGLTLVEFIVVLFLLAVLASILFPVFVKAREDSRKINCISLVRQIAVAIQMYAQDNAGQYPGTDWKAQTYRYLGASDRMYQCPQDKTKPKSLTSSYGYAGILVDQNGKGIFEKQVISPSEVGSVCDVTPSTGGLVGGGALQPFTKNGVTPTGARHDNNGVVAGFCDGHAKYFPGGFNPHDMSNGIARAFFQVASLGLIDNPVGCLQAGPVTGGAYGEIEIGGEYAASPILRAAATLHGKYKTRGFLGQYAATKRAPAFAWGVGDGVKPAGHAVAVARDIVVVIVSKNSKIGGIGSLTNSSYVQDAAWIRNAFRTGYIANSVQAYTLPAATGTRRFFCRKLAGGNTPLAFGKESVEVANDAEMVDTVANDKYGIGYCSSVFADPDRVVVIALQMPNGKVYHYPNGDINHRWIRPATLNHPMARTLYLKFSDPAWTGFGAAHFGPTGKTLNALAAGPLYQSGYWKP